MIKNLDAIETALGLKAGEFKTMFNDKEERELPLANFAIVKKDDHEILSKADYAARIANLETAKYNEGKTAQEEIINKTFAKAFGLEISGEKAKKMDIDYFKTEISNKILSDAKIEPNKKVAELEADKQKALQIAKEWETKYQTLEGSAAAEKRQAKIDGSIYNALPAIKNPQVKTKIPASDMALIFKSRYNPKMTEDGKVVLHDEKGEVLKSKTTLNPLTVDEVMAEFQVNYLEAAPGGGGGGDNPGQLKPGGIEAFNKEMSDKGINIGSKAYNDEMTARIKNKTLSV